MNGNDTNIQGLINQLQQLQELILILDEHRAPGDGTHLTRLGENIDEMTQRLAPQIRGFLQRLLKKDHIFMAPMHNGACAICGMRLPISQVQSVRKLKDVQTCPSCARILFESPDAAHWVGEVQSRTEPRKSGIARFSATTLMLPNMTATTRDETITELANIMEKTGFVDDAAKLVHAAIERENILTTAMEHGLAFPHVRGVEGGGLTLAMGTSQEGIPFGGEEPSHIICFFVIPTAVSAFYLRLIAGLTEAFIKEQNRTALMAADSPEQLWKALSKATRYTVK